jgi:hypothetical protein
MVQTDTTLASRVIQIGTSSVLLVSVGIFGYGSIMDMMSQYIDEHSPQLMSGIDVCHIHTPLKQIKSGPILHFTLQIPSQNLTPAKLFEPLYHIKTTYKVCPNMILKFVKNVVLSLLATFF